MPKKNDFYLSLFMFLLQRLQRERMAATFSPCDSKLFLGGNMEPSSTSNKLTQMDNEQEWIIPNPKKVSKDHYANNSDLIPLNWGNSRIDNVTQSNFQNSLQNNSKYVAKNIEKKKLYEVKNGNSKTGIQQQSSLVKTKEVKASQQANVNLIQEWENKSAQNIEVELKSRVQKLESEIIILSIDFIKASKES